MHYLCKESRRWPMALKQAKIQPTLEEKRYITLQFLEAAFVSGSEVNITPVEAYGLSDLSGERFVYQNPVNTYVIFDERPTPKLLQRYGWYRENADQIPIVAYIATHLLYNKNNGEVVNESLLDGDEMQNIVQFGESSDYELKDLKITRGAVIEIFFDFNPDKLNKFYVADVKTDLVSINYVANLVPFKNDKSSETPEDANRSNQKFLNTRTEEEGL
jgi:hypothetical protein